MLQGKSGGGIISNISTKTNQNPASKASFKARSSSKQSVLGVSNICVSIRRSKRTTDDAKQNAPSITADAEVDKSEKGIQVDEVELIANNCECGDAPNVLPPSVNILREMERDTEVKQQQLKARLKETRQLEEHSTKRETHLTNLNEFMDRGAITRKRQPGVQLGSPLKSPSDRTKTETALEAYERVKRKEEELLKMFNSVQFS